MAATTVSSLEVEIGSDISGLTKGLSSANKNVSNFAIGVGTGLESLGSKASDLGGKISAGIQPLFDFTMAGLDVASGFEDIMVQLETFGGLAGDELESVRALALKLGADTKFSASDAAAAMLELSKSGLDVEASMQGAEIALQLAAVGGLSVANAAGIMSSAVAMFELDPIDEAVQVVDALSGAANASRADVQSLSDGLTNVGPVAHLAGLSIFETSAALAVLADNGIEGAEAGTQLKSLLLSFQGDTAAAAFDKLGVSLYDATGNTRDFDTVLDELALALADKTPEEQADLMKKLAGSYGITALSALLAAGGIDEMQTKMDAAPAASDIAAKSMSTFSGKVDGLKGSVETLMITGLTPLMENVLGPLVEKVTGVVNAVTEWADANPGLASTLGGIVLALGFLGTALTILGPIIGAAGTTLKLFGITSAAAALPLIPLIAGIGVIVALLNDPNVQAGLKAFGDALSMLPDVLAAIGVRVQAEMNTLAATIRMGIRDIEEGLLNARLTVHLGLAAAGIDTETNTAIAQGIQTSLDAIAIAEEIETAANTALASGEAIELDTSKLAYVFSEQANTDFGTDIGAQIASKIADPVAIQTALDAAIAAGDVAGIKALLPITMEIANDPKAQMQELLTTALSTGEGEEGASFQALLPMATELDIDTASLTAQYDAAAKAAAEAKTFAVTMNAQVKVNVISVAGLDSIPGVAGALPVPGLATGGQIQSEGLAYLHAGERVLNAQETAAYNAGRGLAGGAGQVIIQGVQSVDDLLYELARRGYSIPR